jgi:CRP-like cAMP-binding protein
MQWVGEDVVIMGHNEPYRYSVVAVTRMKVYAIEKQDLLQRLNVTFISHLIKQAKIRTEWIEERIKQIHYSVKQIDEMQEVTKEDRDEWKRNKLY